MQMRYYAACARRYGLSAGDVPCEKHLYTDSTAVYKWMTEELALPPERIILYGKSLGTAPTIDLGTRLPSNIYIYI